MSDSENNRVKTERDNTGRFVVGNKIAKKDFNRSAAKQIMWDELKWAANVCCNVPTSELKKAVAEGLLDNESILTYSLVKKFVQGDSGTMRFLTEMIVGKAVQRIDQTDVGNEQRIEKLEDFIRRTQKN